MKQAKLVLIIAIALIIAGAVFLSLRKNQQPTEEKFTGIVTSTMLPASVLAPEIIKVGNRIIVIRLRSTEGQLIGFPQHTMDQNGTAVKYTNSDDAVGKKVEVFAQVLEDTSIMQGFGDLSEKKNGKFLTIVGNDKYYIKLLK